MDKFYDYYDFPEGITATWQKLYDLSLSYRRAIGTLLDKEYRDFNEEWIIKSERDIFPILILIHIYLELVLKALIYKHSRKLQISHDLKKLLDIVKEKYSDFELGTEGYKLLQFLNTENPQAAAFRYNFDKNGNEYFQLKDDEKQKVTKGISYSFIFSGFKEITGEIDEYLSKLRKTAKKNI